MWKVRYCVKVIYSYKNYDNIYCIYYGNKCYVCGVLIELGWDV